MGTALQVTANTQQAVGAFNQLAQAVANATTQFQTLNNQLNAGHAINTRYGTGIERVITGAFEKLQHIVSATVDVLKIMAGVIGTVFSALLKELDKLQGFGAIMSVTTKSTDEANASYDFLRKTADRLGVQFDALTSNYAKLVASIPEGVRRLDIANKAFMGVAMAARTLHSSNQETQLMFYAVTQMASKGVVSMEELRRQLGEKLPGVMNIAAKALNTTPELMEAAIRKGTVNSAKFLEYFGDQLIRTFSDSSERASQTVSASLNRLTNVWVDFVKEVLDSGAGNSIVNLFDALREKLSDPYVIERFGQLIKFVADKFTEFITNLTKEDIRNGFDTMANGIEMLVKVLGKFVELMTWVINNADRAGSVIGAVGGMAAGAVAGAVAGSVVPGIGTAIGATVGAVGGAAVGVAGGYAAGRSVMPTAQQKNDRIQQDILAQAKATHETAKQQFILEQQVMPLLQSLKGLNTLADVKNLIKPENLNEKTVKLLEKIFTDKRYKTDADRVDATKWLSKSGQLLGPNTATLADVLQPGKPKKQTAEEKALEATRNKAWGFDPNFFKEWERLNLLYKQHIITTEQLEAAEKKLLSQQPFMEEAAKREKHEVEANNKAYEAFLELLGHQIVAKEKLRDKLADDLHMAGMRSEDAKVETQVVAETNKLKQVGIDLSATELAQLREKFHIIEDTKTVTQAGETVLKATVDKWKPQIDMLKGIQANLKDPTSGLTKTAATDYLVGQDPNAQGSQQWQDAQRRALEEYYTWVDTLRQKDLISEQTAQQMKAKAAIDADAFRVKQATDFFGNLAALASSGSKRVSAIGKAAAVAQATIDGYVAVQKALANPPGPPYSYAFAAAAAVAAAANVAKIMGVGFDQGGYTGNAPRSTVTGLVHGQEYVVNASATARNRATLEAINAGRNVSTGSGGSGGQSTDVKVIVNNNAPDTQSRVTERETPNGREIEVTIERVVVGSIRKGGRIADAVENQYGLNRAVGTVR